MTTDFAHRVKSAASHAFGWPSLRPGQLEAIDALLHHTDVLAVMPTGYGKSAIYQLAGVLQDGPTIVVSPLIALQNDQIAGLDDAPDAPSAVAVNSSNSDGGNEDAWLRYEGGDTEFLFLAPEQLAKQDVIDRLRHHRPTLFVVDEAHCVSAWGHDFRPDYLRLGDVVDQLGHPTVCALTATGSAPVRDEIVERLRMRAPLVLTRGFDRPNLRLEVERHSDDREKRDAVIEQVLALPKPGLLYVATRKDTERYAEALRDRGLAASAYHAGLRTSLREQVHEEFLDDQLDVVVATSAFGMGIDKRNVRFVVHAAITESLDAYYQEIGRAGRDGEPATTTLHYRQEDLGLRSFFASGAPDPEDLARVFAALPTSGAPLKMADLAALLDLSTRRTSGLVNLLQEADAAESGRRGVRATARIAPRVAAERALDAAESRERIEHSRLAMMRNYAETLGCRRQFLLGYFGEDLEEPCGNCDTCASGSAAEFDDPDTIADEPFPLQAPVTHADWGDGVVMRNEDDRVTVFFKQEGYKVLSRDAIEKNDLLRVR